MENLTKFLRKVGTIGGIALFSFYVPKLQAQTQTNGKYVFSFKETIETDSIVEHNYVCKIKKDSTYSEKSIENTIICVPGKSYSNYFYFTDNNKDTIFIKGDSIIIKSDPIYITDTIFQRKYNEELSKQKDLQNRLDSLLGVVINIQGEEEKKKNYRKEEREKERAYRKKNREERKEKRGDKVKKDRENKETNKIIEVAGKAGFYVITSPYYVAKGLYLGGKWVVKKISNPFKDCPCDKTTGQPLPSKIDVLWLKNIKETSKKNKSGKSKSKKQKSKFNGLEIKCSNGH